MLKHTDFDRALALEFLERLIQVEEKVDIINDKLNVIASQLNAHDRRIARLELAQARACLQVRW